VTVLRSTAMAILALLATAFAGVGHAQIAPPPKGTPPPKEQTSVPPDMTQEQFDSLVNAITKSVLEKLKSEGVPAAGTPPAKPGLFSPGTQQGPDDFDIFLNRAAKVMRAVPTLGHYLARLPGLLDQSAQGGHARPTFLLLLALAVAGALACEAILRRVFLPLRSRLAVGATPDKGLRSLTYVLLLALLDGLGVLAVWLIGRASIICCFSGSTLQDAVAFVALAGLLSWRLYALVFRIILRPELPPARLCDMDDDVARRMYGVIASFVLLVIGVRVVLHVLFAIQAPPDAIEAGRVLLAPVMLLALVWVVLGTREGVQQWLGGLGRVTRVARFIGRNWAALAIPLFIAFTVTQIYGAISGRMDVPTSLLLTTNLIGGLLIFETLLQAVVRRLDSQLPGFTPASDTAKLPDVIARCVRVAVLIGIAVAICESWVVDVLGLVDASAWNRLARASSTAGITLFTAFVLWELFNYAAGAYVARLARNSGEGAAAGSAASRLDTLLPLLRITIGIILATIAALIALEELGVNVTPLLAGASVLGLALSFGSQTLVKDIVSGIFYLADDAFRVGEFIDCGKAKGIVEGFTLRSIRLRQSNGQMNTIPFGELGQIGNLSRDWASVKFSLRFARDTDLDKLREATKTISAELMDVPELKAEIIEPLKMQGVDEVADNALVIRFKFMARPGNPGSIQNAAVTNMLRTFPKLGIEFAK
jgi:small-conductance mechanosensitive channel